MIKDNDLISVRNRNNGKTGYEIKERHLYRSWEPNEVKKIPFEELRAFAFTNSGLYALNNLLVVENEEALKLLNMDVEQEYFYTEDDIRKLLYEGSMDEFADFIDFAPDGAIEVAKAIAVKEEIPDIRKRDMISKKTGVNINNAIMINHVMNDESEKVEEAPKERRVKAEAPASTDEKPARRVTAPQYKVVTK